MDGVLSWGLWKCSWIVGPGSSNGFWVCLELTVNTEIMVARGVRVIVGNIHWKVFLESGSRYREILERRLFDVAKDMGNEGEAGSYFLY